MAKVVCKICDQEFETDKSLHLHLKKHRILSNSLPKA